MGEGAGLWRIGENLPWTAPWTGEAVFGLAPSPIFPGLRELTQKDAQGEGEPQLVGMHLGRQRRAILNHLCQVCGEPTTRGDRFLFPSVTGTFLKVKGRARYATHMPPVHGACAERAMRMCPHLRGAAAKPVAFPMDEGFLSPETSLAGNVGTSPRTGVGKRRRVRVLPCL